MMGEMNDNRLKISGSMQLGFETRNSCPNALHIMTV